MTVNRRYVLRAAGGALTATVAGCLGDDSDGPAIETSDGPAEFAVYGASWSDSSTDSLTVDSEATLDIVVGNRGGEAGEIDVEGVLRSLESESTQTVEVSSIDEPLASGQAVTVTTERVPFEYAGRYEVTASANGSTLPIVDDADAEVTVDPLRGDSADAQPVSDDLRLQVDDVEFVDSLHYDTTYTPMLFPVDRVSVHSSASDHTLVLVHATVENVGSDGATFTSETTTFAGEPALTDVGASLDSVRNLDTSPLEGASVNPGSRVTGWILFTAEQSAVGDATLSYHRDSTSAPADVVWDLDVGDVSFPNFELVDVDVPSQFEDGYQEFAFTIENTGEDAGTFRGDIEWREDGDSNWQGFLEGNADLEARIPAGETAIVRSGTDYSGGTTHEYRLNPLGATFVVEG